jgi:hypothetical protein
MDMSSEGDRRKPHKCGLTHRENNVGVLLTVLIASALLLKLYGWILGLETSNQHGPLADTLRVTLRWEVLGIGFHVISVPFVTFLIVVGVGWCVRSAILRTRKLREKLKRRA